MADGTTLRSSAAAITCATPAEPSAGLAPSGALSQLTVPGLRQRSDQLRALWRAMPQSQPPTRVGSRRVCSVRIAATKVSWATSSASSRQPSRERATAKTAFW